MVIKCTRYESKIYTPAELIDDRYQEPETFQVFGLWGKTPHIGGDRSV